MASSPYARVEYLIGRSTTPVSTPTTLTGGPEVLYSYQLKIAYRDGLDWLIYADKNSPTTNRHINAVAYAIADNPRFTNVGTETIDGVRYQRYQYQ